MSDLNSTLIEGTVKTAPEINLFGSRITIVNTRHYLQDGETKKNEYEFPVTLDQRLTKAYKDLLKKGMKVRVVANLTSNNNQIEVSAEFIEAKKS